jgi:hypothetical protein
MSKSADTEPNSPSTPPDREALLDELARCFVQAAVTRLLEELRQASDGLPDKFLAEGHSKKAAKPDRAATARRPPQRRAAVKSRRGTDCGLADDKDQNTP